MDERIWPCGKKPLAAWHWTKYNCNSMPLFPLRPDIFLGIYVLKQSDFTMDYEKPLTSLCFPCFYSFVQSIILYFPLGSVTIWSCATKVVMNLPACVAHKVFHRNPRFSCQNCEDIFLPNFLGRLPDTHSSPASSLGLLSRPHLGIASVLHTGLPQNVVRYFSWLPIGVRAVYSDG